MVRADIFALRGALVIIALGTTSCFLDRSVRPGQGFDGGPLPVDAGPPKDADSPDPRMDASTPDGGMLDAGVDAGPRDAGPRDAGPPDAGTDACVPADEVCNTLDDDCDGDVDEDGCNGCTPVVDGSLYVFCTEGASWEGARARCGELGEGLDLVIIESAAEQSFVWGRASSSAPTAEWWLGMSETEENPPHHTYSWVDETVAWESPPETAHGYENWRDDPREPEHDPAADCIQLDVGSGGQWADHPCDSALSFVCEGPAP